MNDILQKSDVKSRRQDQTQLDSASERKKKMSQSQVMLLSVCFTFGLKRHASWLIGGF